MDHGATLATDPNVLPSTGDCPDRAGRPEEGDWHLLRVTGLATISLVHQHQVALRHDQEAPGALLASGCLGEGELLAVHHVFTLARGNLPQLRRALRVARGQRAVVEELHSRDRTTAQVSARTSVSAFENRQVSSPCHFHSAGLGFRPVFLIATDVSEHSSLTFVWLHALGHLTCAYVWL